jgi:hypothetical protein
MRFGQHLDLANVSVLSRSALIAGAVTLGVLTASPLATAQDRAQSPAQAQVQSRGDKDITAQVQKAPTVNLPSLNPVRRSPAALFREPRHAEFRPQFRA